jgi:hypothetical protein
LEFGGRLLQANAIETIGSHNAGVLKLVGWL